VDISSPVLECPKAVPIMNGKVDRLWNLNGFQNPYQPKPKQTKFWSQNFVKSSQIGSPNTAHCYANSITYLEKFRN
jgi:hypothetical protein